MAGNWTAIITGNDADLVEGQPPSRGLVDPGGETVKPCPPGPAI